MFDLIAGLLAFFYELVHSYAGSILILTLLAMVAFTPLILRSTKSMLEMRALQPKLKKLQKKYADDRQALQQEQMKLYQEHGVNPVSGCLPMLFQAPVFLVLYRVISGLTRRTLDTGFATGNGWFKRQLALDYDISTITASLDPAPAMRFNPAYLDHRSQMYRDLASSTEMRSFGIDLSRSASEMVGESVTKAIPYLVLVLIVGALSLFQNRQIQGRNTGAEMNPQMEMITKIMPWFLPVFAFTLPAAMCVYFFTQSVVRVGQQAYITRRFYGEGSPFSRNDEDDDDVDDDDDVPTNADESSTASSAGGSQGGGLMGMLMGTNSPGESKSASAGTKHGNRAPVTSTPRRRTTTSSRTTPKTTTSKTSTGKSSTGKSSSPSVQKGSNTAKSLSASSTDEGESAGLWSRARRRASAGEAPKTTEDSKGATTARTSKRVTPKSADSSKSNRK